MNNSTNFPVDPGNEHFCITMMEHYRQRLQKRVCFCSNEEYAYLMSSYTDYANRVAALQVKELINQVNKENNGQPNITC